LTVAAFEPLVFPVLGFFVVFENERERVREREKKIPGGRDVSVREALFDNRGGAGGQRRLKF
jgi:hypothetical protein